MATQYAGRTTVTKTATLGELERILDKYGATSFISGTHQGHATIAFQVHGLNVLMSIPLPQPTERRFTHTPTGRARPHAGIHEAHQEAVRATWRSLLLFVKAKLVGIDQGLTTIEREFLPYILLPGGETFGDHIIPKIRAAYAAGEVPDLMPAPTRPALEGPRS